MIRNMLLTFCGLLLLVVGCSDQETPVEKKKSLTGEVKVIVPESVVGKWKSVKIALHDQQEGTESVYQVDIGGSFQISETNLRVKIANFMPAFSVNSERATSASNQPTNPAVQIVVSDSEQEIHRDWVFGLYPDRHQFVDSRYKFLLLDYKPQQ